MEKKLDRLNDMILSSKIDRKYKDIIIELVKIMQASNNNRINIVKTDEYVEYLSLRLSDDNGLLQIVIIRKLFEYSGATAEKIMSTPTLEELVEYIKQNRSVIDSRINSVKYAKQEDEFTIVTDELIKKAKSNDNHPYKTKLASLNLPDYMTSRTSVVLDRIINGERIYAIRENEYEEYLSIIDGAITVTQKMIDSSGATAGRKYVIIGVNELLDYVEQNHAVVDKSIGRKRII